MWVWVLLVLLVFLSLGCIESENQIEAESVKTCINVDSLDNRAISLLNLKDEALNYGEDYENLMYKVENREKIEETQISTLKEKCNELDTLVKSYNFIRHYDEPNCEYFDEIENYYVFEDYQNMYKWLTKGVQISPFSHESFYSNDTIYSELHLLISNSPEYVFKSNYDDLFSIEDGRVTKLEFDISGVYTNDNTLIHRTTTLLYFYNLKNNDLKTTIESVLEEGKFNLYDEYLYGEFPINEGGVLTENSRARYRDIDIIYYTYKVGDEVYYLVAYEHCDRVVAYLKREIISEYHINNIKKHIDNFVYDEKQPLSLS